MQHHVLILLPEELNEIVVVRASFAFRTLHDAATVAIRPRHRVFWQRSRRGHRFASVIDRCVSQLLRWSLFRMTSHLRKYWVE